MDPICGDEVVTTVLFEHVVNFGVLTSWLVQPRASTTPGSSVEPALQSTAWGAWLMWGTRQALKNDPSNRCAFLRGLRAEIQQESDHRHPTGASPIHAPPARASKRRFSPKSISAPPFSRGFQPSSISAFSFFVCHTRPLFPDGLISTCLLLCSSLVSPRCFPLLS